MKTKKILAFVLSALMLGNIMPKALFGSKKVESNVTVVASELPSPVAKETADLEIGSKAELVAFANRVNAGETFEGKLVALTSDIDLEGMAWTPIGYDSYGTDPEDAVSFNGTFDGRGHTISNLTDEGYVPSIITNGEYGFGLFGYAYGANFKNVTLENVDIHADGLEVADGAGVAALVGYYRIKNGSSFVIENCHLNSGSIYATNNMGGLVGYMDGYAARSEESFTHKYGWTDVFNLDGKIINCSNSATVTTRMREAGGIVGLLNFSSQGVYISVRGDLLFENCKNYGAITAEAGAGNSCAAGILGRDNTGALWYFGGRVVFENCYNGGAIKAIGQANAEVHASGIGTVYFVGGMTAAVKNCVNEGTVEIEGGKALYLGEIFAASGYLMIENCTVTDYSKLYGCAYRMLFVEQPGVKINENAGALLYLNGAKAPDILTFGESGGQAEENVVVKENHFFDGWYNNPEFTGEQVFFNNGGNDSGIFYAKFRSFEEVYEESTELTLEANVTFEGFVIDKDITIDLAGNTFRFDASAINAQNIPTAFRFTSRASRVRGEGLQIAPNVNVTIKNGTIAGTGSELIHNYANLTLENVTINARELENEKTALVNYEGTTTLINSRILTPAEGVALAVRDNGNESSVIVENSSIEGAIVLTNDDGGEFSGKVTIDEEEITEEGLYAQYGNDMTFLKVDTYNVSLTADKTALKATESVNVSVAIDKAYYAAEYTFTYDTSKFVCSMDNDGDGVIFVGNLYQGEAGVLATYTLTAKDDIQSVYEGEAFSVSANVIQYKEQILNGIENVVVGDTETVKVSLNYTASVKTDFVQGYSLVLVNGDHEGYAYNGVKMFYVEAYGAYAILVEGTVTAEEIDVALSKATGCETIRQSYNVNGEYVADGIVDIKDATAVYACSIIDFDVVEYMELYLRADVNGDCKVNMVDINAVVRNYTR